MGHTERDRDPHRAPEGPPEGPYVLGILGGIGSGKSTVAGLFEAAGFVVLDADQAAREVLDEPDMRRAVTELLGPDVAGPDGLDRGKVAAIVFGDAELRDALERLVHPRVRERLLARLDEARAAGRSVVLDVPLLLEKGMIEHCDYVLFVDVPDGVRRARAEARGLSGKDWRRREATQAPLAEKRARADWIVDNGGTPEETRAQLQWLLRYT